jgi:hypothetical protein
MVVRHRSSSVRNITLAIALSTSLLLPLLAQETQQSFTAGNAKAVGTISTIGGNTLVVTKDDGAEVKVNAEAGTRFARIAPGQKDLKTATPIQVNELQPGDRVLVRGTRTQTGDGISALTVLVMKKADVEAKQQTDRQDWQHRGVAGIVTAVDAASGTVTISTTGFAGKRIIAVRTTKDTSIRRYAWDSIKFDDAKISSFDRIKPGDQLRARGTRSADGSELAADEIVSGSFRNIAGTVTTTDSGANAISVADLTTKKALVVKITSDSQVRKLPPEMAQHIAMRLKAANPSPSQPSGTAAPNATRAEPPSGNMGGHANGMGPSGRAGGPSDFQQMLNRLPPATLADFQKGDAVMIVSTEGVGGEVTAITLLGGVEPILAASPSGAEPMRLSPWTLGSGGGEEASQ